VASHKSQIAIITDDPGWHGRQLKQALSTHGLASRYVSLTDCQFLLGESEQIINLPGFEDDLPLGVFVRGVPGGSLEQVIFRLDVLHALCNLGITIYNDPQAIERTVDKTMTSFLLKRAGLPSPNTWVCESQDQAEAICQQEFNMGRRLLMKPMFGSQGIGIQMLDHKSGLIHEELFSGLYYLQSFIERDNENWFDIRVFVVAGKARAAMLRRSESWITNRAQGAHCEIYPLDDAARQLAEAAVKAVDIDYAGVDLIHNTEGKLQVIEVNSIPAWWGLQKVTDFNIASLIVDHFVRRIREKSTIAVLS
jgi:RimK family alpha-L-glutamate ligase